MAPDVRPCPSRAASQFWIALHNLMQWTETEVVGIDHFCFVFFSGSEEPMPVLKPLRLDN